MPRLFASRMQPNAVRPPGPIPMVERADLAAAVIAAPARPNEAFGYGPWVVCGGLSRGGIASRTIFGLPIRPSVQTRMAVGQLAVFRSVRNAPAYGSKIV